MKNIDYAAYLASAGLADYETSQIERIKKYLEEQCEKDEALRVLYRAEKMDDCYHFIEAAVKAMPNTKKSAFVEDAVVFKMARDFFIEVLPKVAEDAPAKVAENVVKVESVETPAEVVKDMNKDAGADDTLRDEYGFEVFGEEAEEAPCEQAEEKVEEAAEPKKDEPEEIRYDPNGQALLFDFM